MKRVIEIDKIIFVPDDFIECSVCGRYKAPILFRNEGESFQSRTNCNTCYETSAVKFTELKEANENNKRSLNYRKLEKELKDSRAYFADSIPVEEMIVQLQKLPKKSRIIVTQDGYYASGELASIFSPRKEKTIDEIEFYSIGHSSQNY